ncbi:MAG TPA: EamA family transporter [Steroidobacteraceae bacterium]|nr:EamA family transporter [Steroidobacteraceae bacterium]
MTPAARQRRMLVLCLAAVYLIWGTSYLATRVGVLHLPPLLFGGARFLIAGSLLTGIAFWRGFRPAHLAGQWQHLVVMSLLGIAICNGLQVWAMQWVPSGTSALLNASCALWIVLFGLFGARAHKPGRREMLGLAIGFIGTALLVLPAAAPAHEGITQGGAAPAGATPLLPQLAIVLACVVWSLGTIYMRNHALAIDLTALMGLQMLLGGVWMVLAAALRGEPAAWNWSRPGIYALAYLVVFSACLAYMAYAWLARHATPAQTGTYSYVNPALATVVGYVGLDERMGLMQVWGAAVILAGVLMINWPVAGPPPARAARPAP